MKIIDLLNKIANDELKDKTKIKYYGSYFKYYKDTKQFNRYSDNTYSMVECFNDVLFNKYTLSYLNDEVEIIEDTSKEDKKIKRIQSCGDNLYSEYIGQWLVNKENYTEYDELLMNKINEIIDRLNGE